MEATDLKIFVKDYLPWIVLVLAVGAGAWAAVWICLTDKITRKTWKERLGAKLGMPSWDFTSSWATNITVAGWFVSLPLVSTIGATSMTTTIDRFNYVATTMIFLLLTAAAPLVYNLSRSVTISTSVPRTIIAQGRVFMFIIAGLITTWAAAGQVSLMGVLAYDLTDQPYLGRIGYVIAVVLGLVAIGIFIYAIRTMANTIILQLETPAAAQRQKEFADEHGAVAPQQPARWPLL